MKKVCVTIVFIPKTKLVESKTKEYIFEKKPGG